MESSKALCLIVFVVAFLVTSSAAGRGEGFNDLANQGIHTLDGLNDLTRQGVHTLEGLMGFNDLADQGDINNKYKACCDFEICTRSIPPQCHCQDVGSTCHAACKNCKCTKSNPPQCRCTDMTLYSHGRCTCEAANNI